MQLLRAAIASLVALVAALLLSSVAASAAPTDVARLVPAHTYDVLRHAASPSYEVNERRPPTSYDHPVSSAAFDRSSQLTLTRAGTATSPTTYTYDHSAPLAQDAWRTATTPEQLRQSDWVVSELESGAAAETAAVPTPAEAAELLRASWPTGSALKSDAMHRAGDWVIDDVAQNGSVFCLVGSDGVSRTLVQMPGEVNGVAGRFEWIMEGEDLTHQFFVRGGAINGIPIKP